jgi:hypothetical protein
LSLASAKVDYREGDFSTLFLEKMEVGYYSISDVYQ